MRKVFMSFLGTSNYKECSYEFKNKSIIVKDCKYVQKALVEIFASDFSKEDVLLFFLTKNAKRKNWLDNDEGNIGLLTRLRQMKVKAKIDFIDIPDSTSEEDLWVIFEYIYKAIQQEDEIIFDITHAFRFLPMLGTILLNYSKVLKDIKIKGIYYGAFEASRYDSDENGIRTENKIAPIFDLTSFSELQQWSIACDNFVNSGNAGKIKDLIINDVAPRLRDTKGKDEDANLLRYLANLTDNISHMILNNQGPEIINGSAFSNLRKTISEYKNNNIKFKALNPILDKINTKIEGFKDNDIKNGFKAVEWCIDHDLIQQGITILQEMTITYILSKYKNKYNFDYEDKTDRINASAVLGLLSDKDKIKDNSIKNEELIKMMENFKDQDEILKIQIPYNKLKNCRNAINHACFNQEQRLKDPKKKLQECYSDIFEIMNGIKY